MRHEIIQGVRVNSRGLDIVEFQDEEIVERVLALRKKRLPYKRIAHKLGLTEDSVKGVCRRHGLGKNAPVHRRMSPRLDTAIEEALDRYGSLLFDRSWTEDSADAIIAYLDDKPGRAAESVRAALQSAVDAREAGHELSELGLCGSWIIPSLCGWRQLVSGRTKADARNAEKADACKRGEIAG